MTTKHFKQFAELFACLEGADGYTAEEMRQKLAREVASLCKADNARFDKERFLKASKVNS